MNVVVWNHFFLIQEQFLSFQGSKINLQKQSKSRISTWCITLKRKAKRCNGTVSGNGVGERMTRGGVSFPGHVSLISRGGPDSCGHPRRHVSGWLVMDAGRATAGAAPWPPHRQVTPRSLNLNSLSAPFQCLTFSFLSLFFFKFPKQIRLKFCSRAQSPVSIIGQECYVCFYFLENSS